MQFDLTDLRLFVLTADKSNITHAAAGRHMSLAAASARIKALEKQAGMPLLYREARGVRLTPAGEAFLYHARSVLRQAEQMRTDLQEYGGGLRGHLRVFANTTAVTDFLPEILPGFLTRNPKINMDLQEKPNPEIARGVLDGRADIGIVAGKVDTLGLESIHFSTDQLVLATAKNHRFARRKKIAFAETLDDEQVGMQSGSTLQTFLAQVTDALGKPLKLRIQLSSFDAMCRMIGAGVAVGIVPESAARRNQAAMGITLIALTDPWSVRERYILVRNRSALPRYAESLIETLCAHYR
ncbi:MAG: LysR family transcriptional regulator [Polaromonas sp.]|uniref:LysR family transcriptional regulator n=1 Tax=Polaromonas sp. TaxID=1869339 RepID=UPI002733F41D|nr:LysR family transcriptional regulator [Polaromonas sp.]MDP2817574.1 LysR family transcriptional regulator [Polaromonas sp.]